MTKAIELSQLGSTLGVDSGSVGIGTATPSAFLQVNSGTDDRPSRFLSSDNLAYIEVADNNDNLYLGTQDGTAGFFGFHNFFGSV